MDSINQVYAAVLRNRQKIAIARAKFLQKRGLPYRFNYRKAYEYLESIEIYEKT